MLGLLVRLLYGGGIHCANRPGNPRFDLSDALCVLAATPALFFLSALRTKPLSTHFQKIDGPLTPGVSAISS